MRQSPGGRPIGDRLRYRPGSARHPGRGRGACREIARGRCRELRHHLPFSPTPEIMAAVSEEWLRGAAAGSLLVDLTTNSPATVRAVGRPPGSRRMSPRSRRPLPAAPSARATASSSLSSVATTIWSKSRAVASRHRTGDLPHRSARLRQCRQTCELADGLHHNVGIARGSGAGGRERHRPTTPRQHDQIRPAGPTPTWTGGSTR